jgi:hypothetical protein
MKITENDKKLFEALNKNQYGKLLVDYLERLIASMFDPETLTQDNLESKKQASKVISDEIIDRIQLVMKKKDSKGKNQFI